MTTLWFCLVAFMLVAYVVFDGFDLGIGALSLWVARTESERASVRKVIGPVWDANEVWLVAAGGTLYFAFPDLYASSFSGFYLPLMIVLWLLMARGLGLELHHHVEGAAARLWGPAADKAFAVASALLAIMFGAALGNVVRGVPLDAEGNFFLPLWTNFRVGEAPGVLDWYTVLCGILGLVALVSHGGHLLAARTTGPLRARAHTATGWSLAALVILTGASVPATLLVRPEAAERLLSGGGWLAVASVAASLTLRVVFHRGGRHFQAFLASAGYLLAMLGGAAYALFPTLLPSSRDPRHSLTVFNSVTSAYALQTASLWWFFALLLVVGYFLYLYRNFREPV